MRIFDSHLHIIDPRFPLVGSQGYRPDPFTCADYRAWAAKLGIVGGAVVSGSFQGFDQSYLLAALETLGPTFVGVTQLPASVSEAEIRRLEGRWVIETRHRGRAWEVIVEPDLERQLLVVVTAYPVWE
jgi:predicted TIM-barrel fold metal-dependent hydrolase